MSISPAKLKLTCPQSSSFYSGLVNVGVGILSAFIYFLAIRRMRSKKLVKHMSSRLDGAEPFRR